LTGNAEMNAKIKAQKLVDLTEDGIKLGFVIGYSGYM